ncbi:MAG: phosphate acyltransferase PlsX [Rickettsiales bacterium]|jgi:glycerol-3-phosphate acyltransferase PlsX|nr:phosphate acyltransferase PlsX [Rickettsiales bacterium]
MTEKITIAIDCMGGDFAPCSVVDGMELALKNTKEDVFFLLYGDEIKIEKCLIGKKLLKNNSKVIHASEVVTADTKPHIAVRQRDTSMRLAIEAVKNNEANAVISAGNTGAYMALAKIILRTMQGIERPALIQLLPNYLGTSTALLDMGANLECDSTNLFQFAIMGWAYYKAINNILSPSIAILNIGSEEMKGNDSIKNASQMLKNSLLKENFRGYVESDKMLEGDINIVVTDGFTGNVVLKAIEGTSKFFASVIKSGFTSNIFAMFGYFFAKGGLNKAKKRIDHKRYNGAMLVGVNGVVVKSHGNADKISCSFAILNTINLVKNKINEEIIEYAKITDTNEII